MVCLGNICRSPLAEGILKSKLLEDSFYIDSAGTASYHIGSPPDERSIEMARINGVDISNQRARAFNKFDFENFDIIYVMDKSNYRDVIAMAKSKEEEKKVKLILTSRDVPDPYYGNLSDFEKVFLLLNDVCEEISRKLLNEKY